MPARACIIGGDHPALPGASRCARHRGRTPGPRLHDSRQTQFRKDVLKGFRWGDPCARCGQPITPADPPEAGHVVARSQGGTYAPANGQVEHRSCNRAAGARTAQANKKRAPRFFLSDERGEQSAEVAGLSGCLSGLGDDLEGVERAARYLRRAAQTRLRLVQ
jgi:hypothetical protein